MRFYEDLIGDSHSSRPLDRSLLLRMLGYLRPYFRPALAALLLIPLMSLTDLARPRG